MPTFIPYLNNPSSPDGWPSRFCAPEVEGSITESDADYAQRIATLQPQYDAMQAAAVQAKLDSAAAYMNGLAAKFTALESAITTRQGNAATTNSIAQWQGIANPTAAQLKTAVIIDAQDTVGLAKIVLSFEPILTQLYKDWADRQ